MELFQILFDLLMAVSPQFAAAVLLLSTLLFGFCSYVFFDTGNAGGGVTFAALALICLSLVVAGLAKGWFRKRDSRDTGNKTKKR